LRFRRRFDVLGADNATAASIDLTAHATAISTMFLADSRTRFVRARILRQAKSDMSNNKRTHRLSKNISTTHTALDAARVIDRRRAGL
jgi:hypothetical protein